MVTTPQTPAAPPPPLPPSAPAPSHPSSPPPQAASVTPPSDGLERPPVARLVLAALAVAAAAGLIALIAIPAAIVGYLLATFVTIGLVGSFRREHTRRRNSPWYSPIRGVDTAAWLLLVAGIVVSLPHIWHIATEVSR